MGWLSEEIARASRSMRCFNSGEEERWEARTLMATVRSRRMSRARYTSPMPPAPSGDWISYGPSFIPEVRAMGGRHYMPPLKEARSVGSDRIVGGTGGPLKPDFGLSGGVQFPPTLSSRPGKIIAKAMICGVEGPAVATSTGHEGAEDRVVLMMRQGKNQGQEDSVHQPPDSNQNQA